MRERSSAFSLTGDYALKMGSNVLPCAFKVLWAGVLLDLLEDSRCDTSSAVLSTPGWIVELPQPLRFCDADISGCHRCHRPPNVPRVVTQIFVDMHEAPRLGP